MTASKCDITCRPDTSSAQPLDGVRRNSPIRVLIVEDSCVIREFLQFLIDRDPRLEVAGAVATGEEALQAVHRVAPDVISMDIRLPGMNGLDATKRIMSERPTPIVVVSASVEAEDLKISINALRAGALAVVEKPVGTSHESYECLAERLCTQLAIMSQVQVIRQRFNARSLVRPLAVYDNGAPTDFVSVNKTPFDMLGIVASTGGPNALAVLLKSLGADFPLPIALVQHITSSFHKGFVAWLADISPMPVVEAKANVRPRPATIYVAPADAHLCVEQDGFRLDDGEPVCVQRPSGTVLFASMARSLGPRALGVLLTGMGSDGAAGLRDIRERGGYTIAEDRSTAVVYGMPNAAVRCGAVCESLPLPTIGPRLRSLVTLKAVH